MEKYLILGVNGQDGSYLAEHLLSFGHEVHGTIRRHSTIKSTERIDHLMSNKMVFGSRFFVHYGDVTDPHNINAIMSKVKPTTIFNLAAQSHVAVSFEQPYYTGQVDGLGTLNVLEAVKNFCPEAHIYQASTSELYGGMGYNMPDTGYTEESAFHPRSPYGVAKIYAYWMTCNYREAFNMRASNGILFNHTSPRRGETFLTRKVTMWAAKYYLDDTIDPLEVGNLNSRRDEGHAKDYIKAMYLIAKQPTGADYVVSTGEAHSVRKFINQCFLWMGKTLSWEGSGLDEVGICDSKIVIKVNPKYFRPSEVDHLLGDSSKVRKLGWTPEYNFGMIVDEMMHSDVQKQKVLNK